MEDEVSTSDITSSASTMSCPPRGRKRKKRVGCSSKTEEALKKNRRSLSSDSSDLNWQSDSETEPKHVWKWKMQTVDAFGIFYENKISEFSDFYDLFQSKGKSAHGFIYPLGGEEKALLNSLVVQTNKMIDKFGVEMERGEWIFPAKWPLIWTKCNEAVKALAEACKPAEINCWNHIRSYVALINFYTALKDYMQVKIDSPRYPSSNLPREAYTALCAKFMEIFLLMPRRGNETWKSVMMIQDKQKSSIPDLRLTVTASLSPPSVFVVDIVEVKPKSEFRLAKSEPFDINKVLDHKILAQHAGELLLNSSLSVFNDLEAVFGIICMQTSLIFTCLKITETHYKYIQDFGPELATKLMELDDLVKDKSDEEEEKFCSEMKTNVMKQCRKSGTIFYTKPYNYLIPKDRRDIVEFLFWIGINCKKITTGSLCSS